MEEKIIQGDDSWLVDGKAAHLEGMTHYCPKCKVLSRAIASENGFMQVNGKNLIVAGDLSSCGSKYIKISDLAVRSRGSGLLSNLHNLVNKLKFDERIQLIDKDDDEPLVNVPYYLKNSKTGEIVAQGITDHNGYSERFYTENQKILIFISEKPSDTRNL